MKYCQFEGLRFPDELSTCRVCGRPLVDAATLPDLPEELVQRIATSWCPSPVCEAGVAPSRTNFCAACGVKLEPISFELWMGKFVTPAWAADPAELVVDSTSLLRSVNAMGLSRAEARERLDRFLEEQLKLPRATLDSWLSETSAALTDGNKQEAAVSVAVRNAKRLGLEVPLAMAVVEKLLQRIDGNGERPAAANQKKRAETQPETVKQARSQTRVVPMRKRSGPVAVEADKATVTVSGRSENSFAAAVPAAPAVVNANGHENFPERDPLNEILDYSDRVPRRPFPWRLLVIVGVAALIVGSVAYLILRRSRESVPTNANSNSTPGATQPTSIALIPGGTFPMGNDDGDEYERPRHNVTVPAFYMDVHEVTNQEFAEFVKATGHAPPSTWPNGTFRAGTALQPVTGVDWFDANAYAVWAKKRLPTEEEWEFAARGTAGLKYPWGNEWRANAANAGESNAKHLVDVGSYPNGKNAAGVTDLIGNAWEWTASDLNPYPRGSLTSRPVGVFKVIRGGSWRENAQQATGSYRGYLPPSGAADYSATGFRCVQDQATATASSRE